MKVDGEKLANELSPRGFSKYLTSLKRKNRIKELNKLKVDNLYQTLKELPKVFRQEYLNHAPTNHIINLIENIPDHKAIDFLQEIFERRRKWILQQLDSKKRAELEELLNYPPDTAGGLMTKQIFIANENKRIDTIICSLKKIPQVIYLVDRKKHFVGQVLTKDLLNQNPRTPLKKVADKSVITIDPYADQEDVINLFLETDRYILPVVNAKQQIIGAITVDNVMDAMQQEASEDLSKLAGTVEDIEDVVNKPIIQNAKSRIPWLLFTVFGEIVFTGNIIHYFDGILEEYISLSFFLPVLMCLSGDSSVQSSIISIQGLTRSQIKNPQNFILKDLKVGVLLGLFLGMTSMLISVIWLNSFKIGLVVGISVIVSLISANLVGASLPIFFEKLGKDPSVSTGPLLTTIMDIVSMLTYFVVATLLLENFFV